MDHPHWQDSLLAQLQDLLSARDEVVALFVPRSMADQSAL
jgi:hypothetical protein